MSVRIRYKISAYVSSTTAEENDLANQKWEVVTDSQGEGGSWKSTLQPGDTDVQLHLGNLATARIVLIRALSKDPTTTPNAITLKRNSASGEEFAMSPLGDTKEAHFVISTEGLTALYASNPIGGTAMDVIVVAAGD